MSPDEMLRVYAEQRKRASAAQSGAPSSYGFTGTGTTSPRSSNGGMFSGFTAPLTPGKKKKQAAAARASKFGAISGPMPISYPTPAAGSGGMKILYETQDTTEKQDDEDPYAYAGRAN